MPSPKRTKLFGSADLRGFALAIALGAVAAAPVLRPGTCDPVVLLTWLAVWGAPAGCLAGGLGLALWPLGICVPGLFSFALALCGASSARDVPTPLYAALVILGLFLAGFGLGRRSTGRTFRAAGILLVLMAALALAPLGGLAIDAPGSPAVRARLLDLSPVGLVVESAGIDWMREGTVYRRARTADIDPSLRTPYQGFLAGPVVLLVGCVLILSARLGKRRRSQSGQDPHASA